MEWLFEMPITFSLWRSLQELGGVVTGSIGIGVRECLRDSLS
jgi:hypothetical protein